MIELNDEQRAMLAGEQGRARQMGMRLLLDLAAMAGAARLVPIASAHLSGVSPLTGGLGPVSYTHLDVYKRQGLSGAGRGHIGECDLERPCR